MNEYMKVAMDLAEENLKTNAGGPFGACIVKDGKIIGKSYNKVLQEQDPTCHAEIMAIREACKTINSFDLSGCEIYTTCYPPSKRKKSPGSWNRPECCRLHRAA